MPASVYVAGAAPVSVMTTTLLEVQPGTFDAEVNTNTAMMSVETTELGILPDIPRRAYLCDAETGAVFEMYVSDDKYGVDPAYLRTP
jgi:hypothetical protein